MSTKLDQYSLKDGTVVVRSEQGLCAVRPLKKGGFILRFEGYLTASMFEPASTPVTSAVKKAAIEVPLFVDTTGQEGYQAEWRKHWTDLSTDKKITHVHVLVNNALIRMGLNMVRTALGETKLTGHSSIAKFEEAIREREPGFVSLESWNRTLRN